MRKGIMAILSLLVSFCVAAPAMSQDFWAVICGVAKYKNFSGPAYADNDARDMYNKCLEYDGATYTKKHVKLLINKKAKKKKIKQRCKWMKRKARYGDVCLFYFSGHGIYGSDVGPIDEADGWDEYICPWNSLPASYARDIRDDELDKWLTPIADKGATVVVILDTCFSGGATKAKVTINGQKLTVLRKTKPGTPRKEITDGVAKDLDKAGFVVMTACDDDEDAYEYPWFQNGIFTYYVIMALTGQADDSWLPGGMGDDNLIMTAEEIFAATVALDALHYGLFDPLSPNFMQTPQLWDSNPFVDLDGWKLE